jgi:hypothetical protein
MRRNGATRPDRPRLHRLGIGLIAASIGTIGVTLIRVYVVPGYDSSSSRLASGSIVGGLIVMTVGLALVAASWIRDQRAE